MFSHTSYSLALSRFFSAIRDNVRGLLYGTPALVEELFADSTRQSQERFFAFPRRQNGRLSLGRALILSNEQDIISFLKVADSLSDDEREASRIGYWRFRLLTFDSMLMAHGDMAPRQDINAQTRIAPYTEPSMFDSLLGIPDQAAALFKQELLSTTSQSMHPLALQSAIRFSLLKVFAQALYGVEDIPRDIIEHLDTLEHLLKNDETTTAQIDAFLRLTRPLETAFQKQHAQSIIQNSSFIRGQLIRDLKRQQVDTKRLDDPALYSMLLNKLSEYNLLLTLGALASNAVGISETLCLETLREPHVFNKLREEANGTGHISLNVTAFEKDMREKRPYHWATLQEALRRRCMVPALARFFRHPMTINGHDVPAGTTVVANLKHLCFDPTRHKNPQQFTPERFLPDWPDGEERLPSAQFGPKTTRGCPGSRYLAYALPYALLQTWLEQVQPCPTPDGSIPEFEPWRVIYQDYARQEAPGALPFKIKDEGAARQTPLVYPPQEFLAQYRAKHPESQEGDDSCLPRFQKNVRNGI